MLWYVLQSIDVSASPKTVSACGASSTLSTTAYFKLFTKNEDNTTSASTNTSETVTASASYSENKSYTSVSGNKIIFDKNAINYPTTSKADARDSIVTGSYTYSGVNKTNTVTVTQSENNVGGFVGNITAGTINFDCTGDAESLLWPVVNEAPYAKVDVYVLNDDVKDMHEGNLPKDFDNLSEMKEIKPTNITFNVLYEDENVLAVYKPQGLLVVEDQNEKVNTLSNQILVYLQNKNEYSPLNKGFTPAPVHRIDRNTSGIVLIAKNMLASQELTKMFKERTNIVKSYLALVKGILKGKGDIEELQLEFYKDIKKGE